MEKCLCHKVKLKRKAEVSICIQCMRCLYINDSNISEMEKVVSLGRRFILCKEHRLGIRTRVEFQLCHKLCDSDKIWNLSEYIFIS